jgi:hypothetical protein
MSNQYSQQFQPDCETSDRINLDTAMPKLAIKPLSEDTIELSDEQAEAISGGQSGLELRDDQLESAVGKRRSIVHIIGFEN